MAQKAMYLNDIKAREKDWQEKERDMKQSIKVNQMQITAMEQLVNNLTDQIDKLTKGGHEQTRAFKQKLSALEHSMSTGSLEVMSSGTPKQPK